jgi:signal transduction histidine kinase/ActR/RegA family two-component response regulator
MVPFSLQLSSEYLNPTLVGSLLSVLVLVGLFHYLNRYTQRRYFTIWKAAWLWYALWLALQFNWQGWLPTPTLLVLQELCVGGSAMFLVWGSACFLGLQTRRSLFGWFLGFLPLWSYVSVFHLGAPVAAHHAVFGFIGLASLLPAWGFYHLRHRERYLGAGLLAFGFLMWAVLLAAFPVVEHSDALVCTAFLSAALIQLFIAVSMIVLTLEEARTANEAALRTIAAQQTEQAVLAERVLASEARYQRLFSQASEAIVIADASSLAIVELNQAASRLLGISSHESHAYALGSFCQLPSAVSPSPTSGDDWFRVLTASGRMNVVRRDGELIPVEVSGAPVRFEGGAGYQFFFRELTERARLEQQLRQAEKLSALGRMISGVAHELNNPLAVIQGYLELVLNRHALPAATREDLEKVARESQRAAKLVRNFLSFARERATERVAVNLNDLVRRVVELRQFELNNARVRLELDLAESLPNTEADPDQVQQVLINLITNAVQAMAQNACERRLRITTRQQADLIHLLLEDSGPGVPEELQARIFEPFFTTKEVGTGTGLGLSIAHGVMAEHHGRIAYAASAFQGAAFLLEFPWVRAAAPLPPAELGTAAPSEGSAAATLSAAANPAVSTVETATLSEAPSASRRAARVLVLDDERAIAELLGEMLVLQGHEPVLCFNPVEALERLRCETFDLVLSDYRMPNMDGQEFHQRLGEFRPELAAGMIFLTGDAVSSETQHFLHGAGKRHLTKPFRLDQVESLISLSLEEAPQAGGISPTLPAAADSEEQLAA